MRNISKTYQKAPDDLKRLYLGLFWDQFKAEDKLIVEATKSPIVLGLEATGALIWNTTQKPDPIKDRAFEKGIITTDDSVILSPVRGAVVEEVRTIFARRNDATIYIPSLNTSPN